MSYQVLATLHVADLFREPRMKLPTKSDYAKIPRILSGDWPRPLPPRHVITPANSLSLSDVEACCTESWEYAVIDTEYDRDTKQLITVGVGLRAADTFTGFQLYQWPRLAPWMRDLLTEWLRHLWSRTAVVFQNTMADVPVLEQNGLLLTDTIPALLARVDDTMLAHAVLWSEWPHSLEFLASMYSPFNKTKHLSTKDPLTYNWGDVCDTDHAWLHLRDELKADPPSERIYRDQSLRVLPGLLRAKKRGIRVNRARVESAAVDLEREKSGAQALATAWTGWPIKLGSVGGEGQVAQYLYSAQGMPVQHKRGARYRKEKKVTVDADAIAVLRAQREPVPDFEAEERNGLSLADAIDRCLRGADPVLEARVVYASATQLLSHYIAPAQDALTRDGRFYPEFLIHAQANARWSTNNPPLAQLPNDYRDIIMPDDGHTWLGWDWDQIELWINALLTNDTPTLDAFANGWDVHTLNMCDCFGYPYPPNRVQPWAQPENAAWIAALNFQGKDDPRRVFAKRFVYRLDYGGDPENAGDIPGAQTLGFIGPAGKIKLVQASQRYLAAHPAKAEARRILAHTASTTSIVRTFRGRRRRLLGDGAKKIRDAFDQPMQAGVADWFNETFVMITEQLPWLDWMYGMHDSQWWQCQNDRVEETWPLYKLIVERPLTINGRTVVFPATFKRREL